MLLLDEGVFWTRSDPGAPGEISIELLDDDFGVEVPLINVLKFESTPVGRTERTGV